MTIHETKEYEKQKKQFYKSLKNSPCEICQYLNTLHSSSPLQESIKNGGADLNNRPEDIQEKTLDSKKQNGNI